jgi:hypothetical protein
MIAPPVQLVARVEPRSPNVWRWQVVDHRVGREHRLNTQSSNAQEYIGVLAHSRPGIVISKTAQSREQRAAKGQVRTDTVSDVR